MALDLENARRFAALRHVQRESLNALHAAGFEVMLLRACLLGAVLADDSSALSAQAPGALSPGFLKAADPLAKPQPQQVQQPQQLQQPQQPEQPGISVALLIHHLGCLGLSRRSCLPRSQVDQKVLKIDFMTLGRGGGAIRAGLCSQSSGEGPQYEEKPIQPCWELGGSLH